MEMDISAAGGMYFAAIHGNGGYGGAERLGTATPAGAHCDIDGVVYTTDGAAQCTGGPCYTYTMQVAWSAFNMPVFDDDKAQYPENPPRVSNTQAPTPQTSRFPGTLLRDCLWLQVWRANFYRTNFIGGQQRNPTGQFSMEES